jgi:twinkle protein
VAGRVANDMTALNKTHAEWLENRGIEPTTAQQCGIYTGARQQTGEVTADESGNILVFPFRNNGDEVGAKYRAPGKKFWSKANCQKRFFNSDVLNEAALISGEEALLIVEGEIDCLSAIQAGYQWAVSVPNGAGGLGGGKVPENNNDIDPENDDAFSYVFDSWDQLKKIKRIILATDNDDPGQRLSSELVRRLGRVRCSFITFPAGCKDLNDILVKHGVDAVIHAIKSAKPFPVSGVHKFSDLPNELGFTPVSTGWPQLDEYLKVYNPALMVVTGFANEGKSTWTTQLVTQVAMANNWNIALASFEMKIKPYVTDHIGAVFLQKAREIWSPEDYRKASEFTERRFCFIAPEPDSESNHDIEWLLERAEAAVIRHGARIILVDPWNEIEHARHRDETMTEYTSRAIRQIKDFSRRFDVLFIIVAHPTKGARQKDAHDVSLYDISDSAAFANKADLGVVIARIGDLATENLTGVFIRKVRYQPLAGRLGVVELAFDRATGTFM